MRFQIPSTRKTMASRSEITANRAATGGWRHRRLSANKLYLQSQGKHARLADDTNHNRNQTPARSDIAASANHRYLIGTYASRDAQRRSSADARRRSLRAVRWSDQLGLCVKPGIEGWKHFEHCPCGLRKFPLLKTKPSICSSTFFAFNAVPPAGRKVPGSYFVRRDLFAPRRNEPFFGTARHFYDKTTAPLVELKCDHF